MNKGEMIDALVADDMDTIFTENEHFNSTEYIHNILYSGFKGYENFDMDELEAECRERGIYDDGENVDIELDPYDETPHEFNTEGKFTIEE
jgi:hypothetical protein